MFIFISDTHIDAPLESHPLKNALEEIESQHDISALFLLGDIFEFWWGDDHCDPNYKQWEDFFKQRSYPIYLIVGNRDFLLSRIFFKKTCITCLPSGSVLLVAGQHIALFHGDEEALVEPNYHLFKRFIRSRFLRTCFSCLPENLRRSLSRRGRKLSRQPLKLHYDYSLWERSFSKFNIIVHGHCHNQEKTLWNGKTIFTLGSWDNNQQSVLSLTLQGKLEFL